MTTGVQSPIIPMIGERGRAGLLKEQRRLEGLTGSTGPRGRVNQKEAPVVEPGQDSLRRLALMRRRAFSIQRTEERSKSLIRLIPKPLNDCHAQITKRHYASAAL
jgi:hypothetical protein